MKRIKAFVIGILIYSFTVLSAVESEMPKLGLVLSGGGAKGFAHIGVLKALEEEGIVPDYITGVSMGSIVGGLYAMGYSADSLEQIIRNADWDAILSSDISEKDVIFEEKKNLRQELFNMPVENWKISVPSSLIQGQQISAMLQYYTFPLATVRDFDSLQIPFKTVAVDIEKCEPVIFDTGNLADAIRASMAIPSAFSAIEIDGNLYVDGGLMHNFPVQEALDMGAEFIIGSYTGGDLYEKNELNSMTAIMAQISNFSGIKDSEREKKKVDILIDHEFGDITLMDFDMADSLLKLGYKTAQKQIQKIREVKTYNTNRVDILTRKQIKIDHISIEGNHIADEELILKYLGINEGDTINQELIKRKIEKLYGTSLFNKIDYAISKKTDKNTLHIRCNEKTASNVNTSLYFSNTHSIGLNLIYLHRDLLLKNSRLTLAVYLSRYYRVKGEYGVYLGKSNKLWTNVGFETSREKRIVTYFDEVIDYDYFNTDIYTGIAYYPLENNKVGLNISNNTTYLSPINRDNDSLKYIFFNDLALNFTYEFNTLDNYYFPTRGAEFYLRQSFVSPMYTYLSSVVYDIGELEEFRSYIQTLFRYRHYLTLGKSIMCLRANTVLTYGSSKDIARYAPIGGERINNKYSLPFWGFKSNEFISRKAFGAGLSFYRKFENKLRFGFHFDSYLIQDLIDPTQTNEHFGIGADFGYQTIIGPLRVGVMNGISPQSDILFNPSLFFSIGYLL
ncbi:MAG: patatin-like phospholipase family protein [Candidatus Marinimicrobia bacterium]|nr:patatin-like phospholipase family protein [Candidatus Neomarinimicrobiota bacterium]